MKVIDTLF